MAEIDRLKQQATSNVGFIRAYGMFWRADEVDWLGTKPGNNLELLGRHKKGNPALRVTNFWNQQGIYVLHNEYGPYYVGKTHGANMGLGKRLRQHQLGQGSPHAGKWDRFSWFGWRGVLDGADHRGLRNLRKMPKKLLTDSTKTVQDIESLLIYALGTIHVGNAREETFAAALKWDQILRSERDRYLDRGGAVTLQQILSSIGTTPPLPGPRSSSSEPKGPDA